MKIGFFTHPRKNIVNSIKWIGKNGFDFADLFFEADKAEARQINPVLVRNALDNHGLDVVGHTARHLPIGSPSKSLREDAVDIIKRYVNFVARFNDINSQYTLTGGWYVHG